MQCGVYQECVKRKERGGFMDNGKMESNKYSEQTKTEAEKRGYELCGQLGVGATASVYRMKEKVTGKLYACKISDKKEWLRLESELLQSLHHPLFPGWKDYWETEDQGCLIMEYIEGDSLQKHLDRRGRFSREETIRVALEIADGLGYLHARTPSVVYRDLKPSNLIVQPDGRIRLLDVGAAAIPDGWKAGTPGYASPEQLISREAVGKSRLRPTSDIYAIGMVMHYMLTGINPCKAAQEFLPVSSYDPDVLWGLDDIIWRCTRPKPEERIPDMRALIHELGAYYNKSRLQIARQELGFLLGKRKKQVIYEKDVWESRYKADC